MHACDRRTEFSSRLHCMQRGKNMDRSFFRFVTIYAFDRRRLGAFLGFADGGAETRPVGPRCEGRRAESGGGVLGERAASLHFKYSGWPLLTPFYVFFDGDGGGGRPPP